MTDEPDRDRVQDRAEQRQRDRADSVEEVAGLADDMFGEHKFPTTGEELAVEYGTQELDLPNETESLGSVFDRLSDERFESAEQAREAVYNEVTGEAAGREEYNDERALGELDEATDQELTESGGSDR